MDTKIMNSTANPNPNPNPNPNKPITTMAFHFTRALANINRNTPKSSSFHRRRRRCRITRAAYASMAVAAGPKRAWSRALLRTLCGRRPNSNKRANTDIIDSTCTRPARVSGSNRVDSLRSLVPGGEAMGLCRLLEESASYIQCLSTQVTIMQRIVDSVST